MQAIASNDIQFGYAGISAAILLAANDVKLNVLAKLLRRRLEYDRGNRG